jgi:hypothetical protein
MLVWHRKNQRIRLEDGALASHFTQIIIRKLRWTRKQRRTTRLLGPQHGLVTMPQIPSTNPLSSIQYLCTLAQRTGQPSGFKLLFEVTWYLLLTFSSNLAFWLNFLEDL